ncbi:protein AF-10-like isoform X3 [Pomacea canaliculata]|uniref:protein AF-10-like isoform X3 n=1 Tax=Pomacea canaliculata TaxID=400727 RepID=UPI000D73A7A9|nr:protein AF-10-like isoform X3 [Pomacea canaliculata]
MKEMVGGCCVCSDERGWAENPLVYCDGHGCNVAVHQACYGIVQVPTGPWYCRKCESQERAARVRCELCPQKDGALKRTDSGGWCHVVCALYIPEAWFANVQTMEPIVLKNVPQDRFNKFSPKICYICEENERDTTKTTTGACMQCNRSGCRHYFHVTCAQAQGLLCEEAGNYGDNVKYCGYCSYHYKKLKKDANIKTIPAFKPIPSDNATPDTTPEKVCGPQKSEKDKKPGRDSHRTSERKVTTSSDSTSATNRVASHPSKPRPLFLSSSVALNTLPDAPQASSSQFPGFTEADVKKSALGQDPVSKLDLSPSVSVANGGGVTVAGGGTSALSGAGNSSNSVSSVDSAAPSSVSSNSSSEGRLHQEPAFSMSENLFASLCNPSLGTASSGGNSNGSSSSGNSVAAPSFPASFENYVSTSGSSVSGGGSGGSNVSAAVPVGGSSNVNLTTYLQSQPTSSLQQPPLVPELDTATVKRQRSKSQEQKEEKKKQKKSKAEVKNKSVRGTAGSHNNGVVMDNKSKRDGIKSLTSSASSSGAALGHHNYASSVFGGSPCFQSPVQLSGLPPSDGENVNGSVFAPPKVFPSLHTNRQDDSSLGFPTSLEQLLERQWEQGAQFMMDQCQHFDIASLLRCLNQLKTENARLEESIKVLTSRRDHLLAVNARLALPFSTSSLPHRSEGGSPETLDKGQVERDAAGTVNKPHAASTMPVSLPHMPVIEPITSSVEAVSPLAGSLAMRTNDIHQVASVITMGGTHPSHETSGQQQLVYSVVQPTSTTPSLITISSFHPQQQHIHSLPQPQVNKVLETKNKDKT